MEVTVDNLNDMCALMCDNVVPQKGKSNMERFYNYVIENYTLSSEAKRMLDSLVLYVWDNFTDGGELLQAGIELLETVVADNIGMDRNEIIENWRD